MSHASRSAPKIDPALWICLVAGFVFILVPAFRSFGWAFLNISLFHFTCTLMIIPHELRHAIVARLMGMNVIKIVIGSGKQLCTLQFLGLAWEFNRFPVGGVTLVSQTSPCWYRSRMFITVLFGPLTNFLLILFALQLPQELVLSRIPGTQFSPGLLFYLANGLIVVVNLFPHYGKIGGEKVSSDGLQLLTLPLLSKRKVNERVALGNVIDGQEWERRGNHHRAIESFNEAIQRDPSCAIAYHARGNVYQAMGDHQKTIENFDQWTLIEPESAMPYLCRGLAHFNWSKNW